MNRILAAILIYALFLNIPAFSRLLETVLKDGIGVRPLGMGGAFTAISDDANGIFYNPAGLGKQKLEYIHGYLDVKRTLYNGSEYSAVLIKDFGFANWYVEDLSSGRVEVTCISYTRRTSGINYGLTLKNVYGSTSTEAVSGYSFDVGLKGRFSESIIWGINFQDIYEVDLDVPVSIRAGLAFDFGTSVFVVEGEGRDLRDTANSRVYPHIGFEAQITQGFTARVGYDKDYYTAGLSITVPVVDIDYAIAVQKDIMSKDSVQRLGFKFDVK